jgi:uncharacterized membrane protein YtjA (UPF0391 family)
MKLERIVIASVVFLVAGFCVFSVNWHGSAGFSAAVPVAQSNFQFGGNATGIPALVAPPLFLIGLVLLVVSAVIAALNLSDSRKSSTRA